MCALSKRTTNNSSLSSPSTATALNRSGAGCDPLHATRSSRRPPWRRHPDLGRRLSQEPSQMTQSRSIHRRRTALAQQLSDLSHLLRQALVGATFGADDRLPRLRVTPAAVPTAPARLAQAAEPAHRAALIATYERYLE